MIYFDINPIIERLKNDIGNKLSEDAGLVILTDSNPDNLSYCNSIKRIAKKNNWFPIKGVRVLSDLDNLFNDINIGDRVFIMDSLKTDKRVLKFIDERNFENGIFSEVIEGCQKITPTPDAIIDICKEYVGKDDLSGKIVLVSNRSNLIGRPLINKLLDINATVLCAHTKTGYDNFNELAEKADIIVTACGKPETFMLKHPHKDCLIVDAGINVVDGKVCGDWKTDSFELPWTCTHTGNITVTPNPGGVGKVTTYELFREII